MTKRLIGFALLFAGLAAAQCTIVSPDPRNWQGTYAGGTTYALCDTVFYSNSAYVAIQASNTGHQPDISGTWWSVLYSAPVNFQPNTARAGSYLAFNYNLAWLRANGGSSGAWGGITGTLASQTDLNTALGLKANLAGPVFTGQPTIPDFTLAGHSHLNAAGGGTLDAAAIVSGIFAGARIPALGASGGGHQAGSAPDPGASSGTTRFLREDATWVAISSTNATQLQGRTLASTAPTDTQVLAWSTGANQWQPSAASGAWGLITGTLSAQSDLNTALGLKAPNANPVFTGQATIPDFTLAGHTHLNAAGGGTLDAAAIASGILAIGRIPTGTSGVTVALGNHLHAGVYAPVDSPALTTKLTITGGTPSGGTTLINPTDGVVDIVRRGLLAEYRMTDAAGGVLPDSSGNGFNGTINGSPTISAQGVKFTASPQRVDLPAGIGTTSGTAIVSACFAVDLGTTITSAGQYSPLLGGPSTANLHLFGGVAAAYPNSQAAIFGGNANRTQSAAQLPYGPGSICFVLDASTDHVYINGVESPSYVGLTRVGSTSIVQTGTLSLAGTTGYALYDLAGVTYYYVTLYSVALTAAEVQTNYDATRRIAKKRGVQFDLPAVTTANTISVCGDSITATVGQGGATTWPLNAAFLTALTDTFPAVYDYAISGRTLGECVLTDAARVDPIYSSQGARNVHVIFAGTNDILGGSTPAQALALLRKVALARKLRGFQVVVVPMLSRTGVQIAGAGANLDTMHDQFNALIALGCPTFADYCIDPSTMPALYADGAFTQANYPTSCSGGFCMQSDGIHPTTAGGLMLLNAIAAGINTLAVRPGTDVTESWTAGTGGVTANTWVKLDATTANQVIATLTSDVTAYGVALSTVAAGSAVLVRRLGAVQVTLDSGTATIGNSAILSTTAAGNAHDSGLTRNSISILNSVATIRTACASSCAGTLVWLEITPADRGTQVPTSQVPNVVDKTTANSYTAGAKQSFQSSATTSGMNFGGVSADPSGLAEGDTWYRTDLHVMRQYQNGAAATVGGGGGCATTPFSSLINLATTSNGSLGCGLTYASAVHTDFTAAATTQSIKLGTAASLFSASGIRIEETVTFVSGVGTITAMQACVGTLASPCAFTPGGLALFGATNQFATWGAFSAAATALATQDIYLTLTVTNSTPGNLSAMTGSTGTVTVRVWGGVAQ